ncbi:DUF4115 domain-containing protein [Zavarzinia compransoris]|uniref:helix-turn-helix domain-containing protein n=1 Tax=Zavarzinia marina TaxID=2911065 RepID=UPI001F1EEA35|nr:helix-turn-helix domain-containing protein [Zavarzinia marina]MCF4167035.1 DUF4115 domain-containing protein [Zavarzinia marina]
MDDYTVYDGVGTYLRDARLSYGRTTAEVGAALRIKASHLDTLERGSTDGTAGLTYALGYLRSYAHYLGLDADAVVAAFKAELNREPEERPLVFPAPVQEAKFPTGRVLALSVVLAVVIYGGYYYFSRSDTLTAEVVPPVPAELDEQSAAEPSFAPPPAPAVPDPRSAQAAQPPREMAPHEPELPTSALTVEPGAPAVPGALPRVVPAPPGATPAPAPTDVVTPSSEPAPSPEVTASADPTQPTTAPPVSGEGRVIIRATAPAWVQIMGAGQEVIFTKILRAGDSYTVPAREDAVLVTGNAGAVEILVDGQSMGFLGEAGQVRRNVPLDPEKLLNGAARPPA